jgi:filamentous hemagglutinin
MTAIIYPSGWPGRGGSGPAPGSIGITDTSSIAALKNYYPKEGGVEFVYAPTINKLAAGVVKRHALLPGSKHEQLALAIGAMAGMVIVGGTLSRGPNGEFFSTEQSGHYGRKWTPEIRQKFQAWFSARMGLPVIHCYEEEP